MPTDTGQNVSCVRDEGAPLGEARTDGKMKFKEM
jgi:hypothetical protein